MVEPRCANGNILFFFKLKTLLKNFFLFCIGGSELKYFREFILPVLLSGNGPGQSTVV